MKEDRVNNKDRSVQLVGGWGRPNIGGVYGAKLRKIGVLVQQMF